MNEQRRKESRRKTREGSRGTKKRVDQGLGYMQRVGDWLGAWQKRIGIQKMEEARLESSVLVFVFVFFLVFAQGKGKRKLS